MVYRFFHKKKANEVLDQDNSNNSKYVAPIPGLEIIFVQHVLLKWDRYFLRIEVLNIYYVS